MGQLSKIKQLHLEHEVLELRQKGWGAPSIAKELNIRHKLEGPRSLSHLNIYSFLDGVSKTSVSMVKEEVVNEMLIEPLSQLKRDLADLRGPLLDKARNILAKPTDVMTKAEMMSLQTYLKHTEEIWDRIAKIEKVLQPEEVIKAKNVVIIQQFNQIKEMVNEIVGECENCRAKFNARLIKLAEVQP